MIKIQNPTQGTQAFDLFPGVGQVRVRIHEAVVDSLMRSSVVVKIAGDVDRMPQATITNKPEAMQAFSFERTEEALAVRIAVGCPRRDAHDLDTSGTQHVIESRFAECTATIVDQVRDAMLRVKAGIGHGQRAGNLLHDGLVGMARDRAQIHAACCHLHHHAHVTRLPTSERQDRHARHVKARQPRPMRRYRQRMAFTLSLICD